MRESASIKVDSGRMRSRVHLPLQEADFSFTRGSMLKRVFSGLAAGMGFLSLLMPWLLTGGHVRKLPHWTGDIIDTVIVVFLLAGLAFFTIGGWAMAWVILLGFFPTEVEIDVLPDSIVVSRRQGLWRRTRCLAGVQAIHVRPPATISDLWLTQPLSKKTARLVAEMEGGRLTIVTSGRPYVVAKEAAIALSTLMSTAGHAVEMVDQVDPTQRQNDTEVPPRDTEYRVEQDNGVVSIEPVDHSVLWPLVRNGVFRAGIWTAVLPYPLFTLTISLRPDLFEPLRPLAPKIGIGCLMIGLMFMGVTWYCLALRRLYVIATDHLIQVTDVRLWRRSKRWKRGEIAAVRIGQRVGDEGRYLDALELVLTSNRIIWLEGGALNRLQYLGTLLRRELGVPAEPPAEPPSAATCISPPAKCPFVLNRGCGSIDVAKAVTGWNTWRLLAALLGCALVAASVAGPVFAWPRLGADDRGAAAVLATLVAALGVLIVVAALYEASSHQRLRLDTLKGLDFARSSAFGSTRLRLRSDELEGFLAEPVFSSNPNGPSRLVVVNRSEERQRLLSGAAELMRYLANELNHVLGHSPRCSVG